MDASAGLMSAPETLPIGIALLAPDGTVEDENSAWKALTRCDSSWGTEADAPSNFFEACTTEQVSCLTDVVEGRRSTFTFVRAPLAAEEAILLVALPRRSETPSSLILLQVGLGGLLPDDVAHAIVPEAGLAGEPALGLGMIVRTIERTMQNMISNGVRRVDDIESAATGHVTQRKAVSQILEILSPRQREVLRLMGVGKSNTEIAAQLGISMNTAKLHVAAILRRLHLENRMQAIALGARISDRET